MNRRPFHLAVLGLAAAGVTLGAGVLAAQEPVPGPPRPEILPREAEMRLALSAAPPHLRAGAGVVLLTANGFVTAREASNGFTCVVNRDHPLSVKPVCYDREGTATVLPKVRFVGEQLLQGVPLDSIDARVARKFREGEFVSPRRPGVAYMLSEEIRNFNPRTGKSDPFPPHLMFYAPDLSNEDLGVSWDAMAERPWLPVVGYQGPHGFIIVVPSREP